MFRMVFNDLSLFMSMSNLIYIDIHFMDMKGYVNLFFHIHVGGQGKKMR
jgi:hypothetical protein